MTYFVDILLPLALPGTLTYEVPTELVDQIKFGIRVVVQLRDKKLYSGLVVKIHQNKPLFDTKPISSIIDVLPQINPHQFELWQWLAAYYMCTLGEIMKAAMPSALKMESTTKLVGCANYTDFEGVERDILWMLDKRTYTLEEVAKALDKKNILPYIKRLLDQQAISVSETLVNKYHARSEVYVRLHSRITSDQQLIDLLDSLKRAPQQEQLLRNFLEQVPETFSGTDFQYARFKILKSRIHQFPNFTAHSLNACLKKEVFELESQELSRLNDFTNDTQSLPTLNDQQILAKTAIDAAFAIPKPVLLHGVTASGKTEVFLHCIEETIRQGKQVLYLLPEIALTTQIITRLQQVLGNNVGVYHSRFNDAERVEIYQKVLAKGVANEGYVILGARSALFLPFENLGLIVVDEEHDSSYKQLDPAPRYNARDAALVLAHTHHANIILGSATPSIESYNNARMDRYALVEMMQRYGDAVLPTIEVVDMVRARKKKEVQSYFSQKLINAIVACLARKEQVILFQNRRGFSAYIECSNCGDVPHCLYCDVSLTYHKYSSLLTCHYCGYSIPIPAQCTKCGSAEVKTCGFGTEKVEDDLGFILPDAVIERLDLDSTRSKHAYEQILERFEQQEIHILVGTQMITKGLDFSNVSLVGILNADNMLNFPDFRAHERSFQLMSQVAGRAGRKLTQGKVLIQTSTPNHPIIAYVVNHDYWGLYKNQAEERNTFFYPPFSRLIVLSMKHTKLDLLHAAAAQMKHLLFAIFEKQLAGPEAPAIKRIQNRYILNFRIKLARNANQIYYKQLIRECFETLKESNKAYASLVISADVDPN